MSPLHNAVCWVRPPHRLTRNRCRLRHIGGKPGASTATPACADPERRLPMCTPTISRVWASRASHTHCLLPLLPTNDHNSSICTVRRRFGFGRTCTSCSTCWYFALTYCCTHSCDISKARAIPASDNFSKSNRSMMPLVSSLIIGHCGSSTNCRPQSRHL